MYSAATAATVDVQLTGKEGEEKVKLHTHSYCCLDYAQVHFFPLYISMNVTLPCCLWFCFREKGKSILFCVLSCHGF